MILMGKIKTTAKYHEKSPLHFADRRLVTGCATSTVQSRKQERPGAYSSLSPEIKSLVDQGKVKVGMSLDAVYIAWGKPAQILTGESSTGSTVTWLYHGTYLEEHGYWASSPYYSRYPTYTETYLEHDYYPRGYVRAEIVFANGVVNEWCSLPQPAN
jgi:hypothetical protein